MICGLIGGIGGKIVAGLAIVAVIGGAWFYHQSVEADRDRLRQVVANKDAAIASLGAIQRRTAAAVSEAREQARRDQAALTEALERQRGEAARLSSRIQEINDVDDSEACPVADSVQRALGILRRDGGDGNDRGAGDPVREAGDPEGPVDVRPEADPAD